MVRVRPLLTWNEGSTEHCALGAGEVNVGDIIFAMVWTTTAVVVTIILVVVLALTKKDNPIACWPEWTVTSRSLKRRSRADHLRREHCSNVRVDWREIPDIPESLLVLMGASLATGGLAYFQDAKNANAAATTGTQLTARSWAWSDLIRVFPPGQEPAPSLAKAQMLFWTVLLLVLFVSKSILDGQIWAVPWPLVALMGFSQLGYLAPKVANPATPTPAPPATGSSTPPTPPPSAPAGTHHHRPRRRVTVRHRRARISCEMQRRSQTVITCRRRGARHEFAQPVQGKRRAGAIAQQRLTSGSVSGIDAPDASPRSGHSAETMRSGFRRASWAWTHTGEPSDRHQVDVRATADDHSSSSSHGSAREMSTMMCVTFTEPTSGLPSSSNPNSLISLSRRRRRLPGRSRGGSCWFALLMGNWL